MPNDRRAPATGGNFSDGRDEDSSTPALTAQNAPANFPVNQISASADKFHIKDAIYYGGPVATSSTSRLLPCISTLQFQFWWHHLCSSLFPTLQLEQEMHRFLKRVTTDSHIGSLTQPPKCSPAPGWSLYRSFLLCPCIAAVAIVLLAVSCSSKDKDRAANQSKTILDPGSELRPPESAPAPGTPSGTSSGAVGAEPNSDADPAFGPSTSPKPSSLAVRNFFTISPSGELLHRQSVNESAFVTVNLSKTFAPGVVLTSVVADEAIDVINAYCLTSEGAITRFRWNKNQWTFSQIGVSAQSLPLIGLAGAFSIGESREQVIGYTIDGTLVAYSGDGTAESSWAVSPFKRGSDGDALSHAFSVSAPKPMYATVQDIFAITPAGELMQLQYVNGAPRPVFNLSASLAPGIGLKQVVAEEEADTTRVYGLTDSGMLVQFQWVAGGSWSFHKISEKIAGPTLTALSGTYSVDDAGFAAYVIGADANGVATEYLYQQGMWEAAKVETKSLIGVNYNQYSSCQSASSAYPSTPWDDTILTRYQQPGVRDLVKSHLAAMRANGIEVISELVLWVSNASDERSSALSLGDPSAVKTYLLNLEQFTGDVRDAGFSRITFRLNPLSLNSPLDYNRPGADPDTAPAAFDGDKYLPINFDFTVTVRNITKPFQTDQFEVEYDLLAEANTAMVSLSPQARSYTATFWKAYAEKFGTSDASFSVGIGSASDNGVQLGSQGFDLLLSAYAASGVGFPRKHMFMYYDAKFYDAVPAQMQEVKEALARWKVPRHRQKFSIVESFYDDGATASTIWHMMKGGFVISDMNVWPWVYGGPFAAATCQVPVVAPLRAPLLQAMRKNGFSSTRSTALTARFDAPSDRILVSPAPGAAEVLVISVYDASGAVLRSSAPFTYQTRNPPTLAVLATEKERAALAAAGAQIRIWLSDGSTDGVALVPRCGENFASCGGSPRSGITSAGYFAPSRQIWINYWVQAGVKPVSATILDKFGAVIREGIPLLDAGGNPLMAHIKVSEDEHKLMSGQPFQIQLWGDDGVGGNPFLFPAACSADYSGCGGL